MLTWCGYCDILIGKNFPVARKFRPISILDCYTLRYDFFRDFFPESPFELSGYISRFALHQFFSQNFFLSLKIFLMGCVCCAQKKSI